MAKGHQNPEGKRHLELVPTHTEAKGSRTESETRSRTESETKGNQAESEAKGSKVRSILPGSCAANTCKSKATQFSFCAEHYDQFKFGLINKSGELVPDYEKKFDHYEAYKAKKKLLKVA